MPSKRFGVDYESIKKGIVSDSDFENFMMKCKDKFTIMVSCSIILSMLIRFIAWFMCNAPKCSFHQ